MEPKVCGFWMYSRSHFYGQKPAERNKKHEKGSSLAESVHTVPLVWLSCHLYGWTERISGGTWQHDGLETGIMGEGCGREISVGYSSILVATGSGAPVLSFPSRFSWPWRTDSQGEKGGLTERLPRNCPRACAALVRMTGAAHMNAHMRTVRRVEADEQAGEGPVYVPGELCLP